MDDRERYLQAIGELIERQSYRQALSVCDKALGVHPHCAEAHDFRGVILCRLGRYREALPCYEKAILLEPEYVPALLDKAELLTHHLGDSEGAIALSDRILRLEPHELDQAHAYFMKGVAYANLDDHEEALPNFRLALELDPDHPEARCEIGVSLYECYSFGEALKTLRQVIEADPRHPRPHHFIGCLYDQLGQEELASRAHGRAAELDSENYQLPFEIEDDDFDAAIEEAVNVLPRRIRRIVKSCETVARDRPSNEHLADGTLRPSAALHFAGTVDGPRIEIYRQSFLRYARSRARLVEDLAAELRFQIEVRLLEIPERP
ncbi:MAG: tetratricopeptide repeat protein [Acidobacteriota bacterium]